MKLQNTKEAAKAEKHETLGKTEVLETVQDVEAPELFGSGDGKNRAIALVRHIRESALAIAADASTEKGRKELRSVAYSVSRCKTTIDDLGKEFVGDLKAKVRAVDVVRKMIRDGLDDAKEEVLKPVTEYESRIQAVIDQISKIRSLTQMRLGETAASIDSRLKQLEVIEGEEIDTMGRDAEIYAEIKNARSIIHDALNGARKREAEEKELEKLRKEKEERDAAEAKQKAEEARKAREEQIRKEEQERLRKEMESKQVGTSPPKSPAPKNTSQPVDRISAIEDSLMDEIAWMMPDKARDIALALVQGKIEGVEVQS